MIKRFAIRAAVAVLALILLGMGIIWTYVLLNKPGLLRRVTAELNSRVNAEVKFGDIDLSFFHSFPDISIRLSKVSVHDSLWKRHHHDLLAAEKIFVQLNPLSLFSNSPSISKILVEDGSVYLFSDSSGYSNAAIFRTDSSSKKNKIPILPEIAIKNLHLVIEEAYRKKLFEFNIQRLDCESKPQENSLQLRLNLAVRIATLSFNTDKGSYLKNEQVAGKIKLQFNPASKVLQFTDIALFIDHSPFTFTGKFFLGEKPPPFRLAIKTEKILYQEASELVPLNIREKLNKYGILNPISVDCTLDGTSTEIKDPLINIKVRIDNNKVTTPVGTFSSVSCLGNFTNQWAAGEPRGDANSLLLFSSFSGNWEDFHLQSHSIAFTNLENTLLKLDLHSIFNLSTLNGLSGSKSIEFEGGNSKMDILYQGPLEKTDSIETQINGSLKLFNASIHYLPRDFNLSGCNGTIRFKGQDVYMENLEANAGSSRMKMSGSAKNLLSLMGKSPEKLLLDWNISSRLLNLHDFISFLGKRPEPVAEKKQKSLLLKTGRQMDRLLKDCAVRLQINANQLIYKKFFASNMAATVLLSYNQVELQNVLLEHAGGSLVMKGSIQNTGLTNSITIQSQMNRVDLAKVFAAFNNFGQTAILDKNLEGKLTADIKINGLISSKAELVANSLTGTVDWSIKDGRLLQFEPLEKISQLAFKNRSFSDIYFAELKDRFEILGTEIKIDRMEIQSTALTLFAQGSYDVIKGADMSIQIPLSNLKTKNGEPLPINKGVSSRTGISLRLRAKTGSDGKLNISWDPFKRALKK